MFRVKLSAQPKTNSHPLKLINSIKPRRHVGETVAVCKRAAANQVYPKIPACEIGDGAVGCCRISEVDEGAKGRSGKAEKVVEREGSCGGGGERSEHTCSELQAGRINGLTY